MKSLALIFLFYSLHLNAQDCKAIFAAFEQEEKAYDTVTEIAIASNEAYDIIGSFLTTSNSLLVDCPKSISLDREYTLKRKISNARQYQQSYKVMSQAEIKQYALTHPEQVVVYKWGTIKSVR